jgi:hypothetical protein
MEEARPASTAVSDADSARSRPPGPFMTARSAENDCRPQDRRGTRQPPSGAQSDDRSTDSGRGPRVTGPLPFRHQLLRRRCAGRLRRSRCRRRRLGSGWPDHRSSNFGACPVVSTTGAPVVSGARVLTSGSVTAGDRSGDVACEDAGASEASCCTGICSCADAAP